MTVKGLDNFSEKFLGGDETSSTVGQEEYVQVTKGQKVSQEALKNYNETRVKDFIHRAGSFTEDLIAFIVEQKSLRNLTDTELVFALALTNINLRDAYASPQTEDEEKEFSAEKKKKLLQKFDEICWGAQQYWEHNKDD